MARLSQRAEVMASRIKMFITAVLIKLFDGLAICRVNADGGQVGAVQLDNPVLFVVLIGD